MLMKIFFALAISLFLTTPVWLTDFDAARNTAAQQHKFVVLNFSGSDWCAPCIKMEQEVFESEEFRAMAEKQLVLVRADFPRLKKNKLSEEQTKHNEALAERYNPTGKFPLTVLLDADGKILKEWEGYAFGSHAKFVVDLQQTLDKQP